MPDNASDFGYLTGWNEMSDEQRAATIRAHAEENKEKHRMHKLDVAIKELGEIEQERQKQCEAEILMDAKIEAAAKAIRDLYESLQAPEDATPRQIAKVALEAAAKVE